MKVVKFDVRTGMVEKIQDIKKLPTKAIEQKELKPKEVYSFGGRSNLRFYAVA